MKALLLCTQKRRFFLLAVVRMTEPDDSKIELFAIVSRIMLLFQFDYLIKSPFVSMLFGGYTASLQKPRLEGRESIADEE